jgi:hypothetical protein
MLAVEVEASSVDVDLHLPCPCSDSWKIFAPSRVGSGFPPSASPYRKHIYTMPRNKVRNDSLDIALLSCADTHGRDGARARTAIVQRIHGHVAAKSSSRTIGSRNTTKPSEFCLNRNGMTS